MRRIGRGHPNSLKPSLGLFDVILYWRTRLNGKRDLNRQTKSLLHLLSTPKQTRKSKNTYKI